MTGTGAAFTPGVRTWGHGPVRVLALHGWLACSDGWDALLPHLDPTRTTWALLDAPGYGGAVEVAGARDVDGWVRHALATLDALGWPTASLVGHSMGGLAIQSVLCAAPHRVTQLVGVAAVPAAGAGLSGDRLALFERATADLGAAGEVIAASTGHRHDPAWVAATARRAFAACDAATRTAYLGDWAARGDLPERLASLGSDVLGALPVDVVAGAHDPSITVDTSQRNWGALYARCRTWSLEGAGHYPADEQPAALAGLLERLLTGHRQ